jgi:hypothetical protein
MKARYTSALFPTALPAHCNYAPPQVPQDAARNTTQAPPGYNRKDGVKRNINQIIQRGKHGNLDGLGDSCHKHETHILVSAFEHTVEIL